MYVIIKKNSDTDEKSPHYMHTDVGSVIKGSDMGFKNRK